MVLVTRAGNASQVYKQATEPSEWLNGDVWVDTDDGKLYVNVSGTATEKGSAITSGSTVYPHSTTIGDYTAPTTATSSTVAAADIVDAYTTNTGWTQVGVGITVDSGVADKVASITTAPNADNRVRKDLSLTLSDTLWYADYEFTRTTDLGSYNDSMPVSFTAGTSRTSSTQDALGMYIGVNVSPFYKDGAGAVTVGTAITISVSTLYYCRLERTSATNLRLNVFSDSARTTHITGSPVNQTIPATVTTLTTLQHDVLAVGSGVQVQDFEIDNMNVYNNAAVVAFVATNVRDDQSNPTTLIQKTTSEANANVYVDMNTSQNLAAVALHRSTNDTMTTYSIQTSTNASTWTTRRTVTASNITAGSWTFWRFPIAAARYVRLYGSNTAICSFNEINVLTPTDSQVLANASFLAISSSDTALNGAGQ